MWPASGPVPPACDDAPAAGTVRGAKVQTEDDEDSCTPAFAEQGHPTIEDGKRLATLRAQAALAGWMLDAEDDGVVVGRWGQSRTLPDLSAAEAFLRQTGAMA